MRLIRFILPFIVFWFYGCETQEVCEENLDSGVAASFYSNQYNQQIDTVISGIYLYGIWNDKPDSLLYDSVTSSGISFPLNPNSNNCRYVFRVNDFFDTISFFYETEVYLVSYTCGFAHNFILNSTEFTTNNIADIEIINEEIDAEKTEDEVHIILLF